MHKSFWTNFLRLLNGQNQGQIPEDRPSERIHWIQKLQTLLDQAFGTQQSSLLQWLDQEHGQGNIFFDDRYVTLTAQTCCSENVLHMMWPYCCCLNHQAWALWNPTMLHSSRIIQLCLQPSPKPFPFRSYPSFIIIPKAGPPPGQEGKIAAARG